jgi:hypothetical protein
VPTNRRHALPQHFYDVVASGKSGSAGIPWLARLSSFKNAHFLVENLSTFPSKFLGRYLMWKQGILSVCAV